MQLQSVSECDPVHQSELGSIQVLNSNIQKCGSLTYSEVGCCQGVCSVAVLTYDGGGVSQLAVVVTSASYAG